MAWVSSPSLLTPAGTPSSISQWRGALWKQESSDIYLFWNILLHQWSQQPHEGQDATSVLLVRTLGHTPQSRQSQDPASGRCLSSRCSHPGSDRGRGNQICWARQEPGGIPPVYFLPCTMLPTETTQLTKGQL